MNIYLKNNNSYFVNKIWYVPDSSFMVNEENFNFYFKSQISSLGI